MDVIKRLYSLYIYGSIHVAVAVLSLLLMTNHMFRLPFSLPMAVFAFAGTITGYNFIKYETLVRSKKPVTGFIKVVIGLSIIALLATGWSFFLMQPYVQLSAIIFLGLTILYALPFLPSNRNIRSLSGIKIYIVALCWAGATILLPLQNAGLTISSDGVLKFFQRFVLVIILILIFEIIDLKNDDPKLQTVPQKIGVRHTQVVNYILLILFYLLELLKIVVDTRQLMVNAILVLITALFTRYANPDRPKYYTLFWVESIPIFWLVMVLVVDRL